MQCPNCGYDNTQTSRFCARCGTDVAAMLAPPVRPTDAAPAADAPPPPASPWGAPSAAGGAPADAPPGAGPAPGPYGPPPNPWVAPPGQYGQPGQYAPSPGYPQPYGYYGTRTNGLAIASLILGLAGWIVCGIGSVVAIVLGFVARSQIRASQGRETGDGMAKAGIILGFVWVGLIVAYIVIAAIVSAGTRT